MFLYRMQSTQSETLHVSSFTGSEVLTNLARQAIQIRLNATHSTADRCAVLCARAREAATYNEQS